MLKAGGEALEKQLIKLFTKVWREERIPKDWRKISYFHCIRRETHPNVKITEQCVYLQLR
jgi:hypothetical protein